MNPLLQASRRRLLVTCAASFSTGLVTVRGNSQRQLFCEGISGKSLPRNNHAGNAVHEERLDFGNTVFTKQVISQMSAGSILGVYKADPTYDSNTVHVT